MTQPTDPEAFAGRWAELWADDYPTMVRECYHDELFLEHAGWGEPGQLRGAAELLATEDRLKQLIPDHHNDILRVISGEDWTVVESTITGTSAHDKERMACPSVVWWRFADDGRIRHEVAYWEWSKRRPDDGSVQGELRPGDGRARTTQHGWDLATRMAELWTHDPERMVTELYAENCRFEQLGVGPAGVIEPRSALLTAERELLDLLPRPSRRMTVRDVAVKGDTVAVAFEIEGAWRGHPPVRRGPGTVVLTLGSDDRIVSDRAYWHFDRARPVS